MNKIFLTALFGACTLMMSAGELTGKILSMEKAAIADAVVSRTAGQSVRTAADGSFTMKDVDLNSRITIWADGYYSQTILLKGQENLTVYLISQDCYKYNETTIMPYGEEEGVSDGISAVNITKKDFLNGSMTIDKALQGEAAGLQVINKSGMSGEGSYFSLRGLRSLVADNAPLIVVNGVPYMPSKTESELIGGYSRNIFQSMNIYDIQDITVLKGAAASLYGSMGSNGVILIETDGASSNDLNTKISYYGQYGYRWNDKSLPLMDGMEYKSYLSDIGMSYYDNMENFFDEFPFLTDPDNIYYYLYQYDTDWQKVVYNQNAMVTDHLLRVEGGDAIAKYDISLGYMREDGSWQGTYTNRYHTQINTNVLVSKKFEIASTVSLAYLDGKYQEQGMIEETNPILAAYKRSPVLSPYKSDINGNLLDTYSSYYFGASDNTDFAVSNPLAIVETMSATNRQYDVNIKVALNYKPTNYLSINGLVGLYYNYDQEALFIPGINNSDVLPLFDQYGESKNTVRVGVAETFNMFYKLNASYRRTLNEMHKIALNAGAQVITTRNEFDAGSGRNTPNDFYQTLGDVNTIGRYFFGFIDVWNWMSYYAHADYTYRDVLRASVNVSADGASSTGTDAMRFGVYPSASLTYMAKNTRALMSSSAINKLNFTVDYGLTGNSRYSSNYGKYYYTSRPYQEISGIIRANVPNTKLKWEEDLSLNAGVDASFFRNKLDITAAYYNTQASDVIMISPKSSVYGTSVYYSNDAAISNDGYEISLKLTPVATKHFLWILGGNLTTLNSKITSLGSINESVLTLSDDAQLISRVGEAPYAFYGYETTGVFSTTAEASTAHTQADGTKTYLQNRNGLLYKAGDMHYVDQNGDGVISESDKVILGSATPDYYGSLYTRLQYRGFALDFNFVYSVGNKAYNAVRRSLESASDFSNQSKSVNRRWTVEGQVTDMPEAEWGDVIGNNDFSDRWIEDASYLKLRDVSLSYSFNKPILHQFVQSGTIYVSAQNLFCLTNYLGLDPEFSYSYSDALQGVDYAKAVQPKTVKIGVNLKF